MTPPVDSIPAVLEPYLSEIGDFIDTCLDERPMPPSLREGVNYALRGGKYLRPLLCVLSAEACGLDDRRIALPAAASLELIHAFSLVHDDLPAMDNDELRRGEPTAWVRFGEAMAVLIGDALHSLAFEMLCTGAYSPAQQAALLRELSHATTCMIAGQVYDTLGGTDATLSDRERLEVIHTNKTGALIRGACRMGAVVAGADADAIQCVTLYGESVGLMFQVVDDLIDVEQSAEHTGKATGKDASAGKTTFPSVVGIEASRKIVENLRARANKAVHLFGSAATPLVELADFMAVRTR